MKVAINITFEIWCGLLISGINPGKLLRAFLNMYSQDEVADGVVVTDFSSILMVAFWWIRTIIYQ